MTPRPSEPRWCNQPGCQTKVILARRAGEEGKWVPLEAADQPAFSELSAGCLVVVDNVAWRPLDLIEHFQTRFEIAEDKARDLVRGYPFHRIHGHRLEETSE